LSGLYLRGGEIMHTKGKWTREGTTVEVVQDGEGKMLVDVYGETQEETEANAHLIAAAPDLLEACKRAFRFIDYTLDSTRETHRVREILARAISKAEGKD
jgi:hypothetical protein